MRLSRCFWIALTICLSACSDRSGEAILSDYEARLSRTLDLNVESTAVAAAPRKPRAEALQLDLQNSDIGTLDFLALTGCELQITIGKRNSSLGKLAPPSQRLLLDLEFLRHAPACIAHLKSKADQQALVSLLEQSQTLKQQQLARQIHNATLAGPEWHQFWKPQNIPVGYPSDTTGDQVLQALDAITAMADNWLRGDYVADNQTFEAHLNTLRSGDGGVILTATQTGHEFFSRWNTTLDEYAQQHACTPESRRTILETVIAKYFAGSVQQWLAPIMSRADNIQQASHQLENLLSQARSAEYNRWRQQRDDYIQAMKSLTVTHVKTLKRVINPC
jgi:hypothetical protein